MNNSYCKLLAKVNKELIKIYAEESGKTFEEMFGYSAPEQMPHITSRQVKAMIKVFAEELDKLKNEK